MIFSTTRQERRILAVLTLLFVLGIVGMILL